ncbi:MAG: hypothetical protein ACXQT1_05795 [Methermicoccaceae archaeon]
MKTLDDVFGRKLYTDDDEPKFDFVLPPGTPQSIIIDVGKRFESIELVERSVPVDSSGNEIEQLLAFRGSKDVVERVASFVREELSKLFSEED